MMRKILFSLLILFSANSFAEGSDVIVETFTPIQVNKAYDNVTVIDMFYSPFQVNKLFDITVTISQEGLPDLVDKENKINACVAEYVEKQSKSYARIAQDNLYDLLHNLDKINSKIYGRKFKEEEKIPREQKLELLGEIQCEAYYSIGEIK